MSGPNTFSRKPKLWIGAGIAVVAIVLARGVIAPSMAGLVTVYVLQLVGAINWAIRQSKEAGLHWLHPRGRPCLCV